ncbi:MAG: sugar phosphate isomerase/epimerase family protein [Bryobacteraceae bacterium]
MHKHEMTRRGLLTAGTAALAASRMTGQSKAKGVRFGVRTPFPETLSLRERAQLVHKLGYDGIELGHEWLNQSVEAIQEQLAGTGVAVSAIVGSIQLIETDPQKRAKAVETDRMRLRMAKALGADCVIEVPTFGPTKFQDLSPVMTPREIEDKLLLVGLKQLTGDVQSTGVTLLLEPLTRKETHFMNLQSHGARVIEAVGSPGFKLLSDYYHMQLEEKDIGQTLAEFGKYTGYVHLADGEKRTEPGSLPFDYRPGFHSLKKWNYSGWLTVESDATDNPEAALGRALKYLKQQWAEA